jgi:hypothetical protein
MITRFNFQLAAECFAQCESGDACTVAEQEMKLL